MDAHRRPYLTPEEYLVIERQSEIRSEYFDGEMFAMSGSSRKHNLIVTNLSREISSQLRGRPCETYTSDQRVHIPATGAYTYPDLVVACGEPRFQDEQFDTLLNPTVIIEVLSPNTEAYDRGEKFENYQTIESLKEYVLVAQDKPRAEHYLRQDGNRWLLTAVSGLDARVSLPSIQCELALSEIYERIEFGA
jgi:Uma2 family endonuclease